MKYYFGVVEQERPNYKGFLFSGCSQCELIKKTLKFDESLLNVDEWELSDEQIEILLNRGAIQFVNGHFLCTIGMVD